MTKIQDAIHKAIVHYARYRYADSCCINLLSWALYSVFGDVPLREACFDYFARGGECVGGPMDLLAGLDPSVKMLTYHYVMVMLYGVWKIVTGSGEYSTKDKPIAMSWTAKLKNTLIFFTDIARMRHAIYILYRALSITVPIVISEFASA
uniref:Squalene monooxygenase n=1 Tax=Lygus hesperus TaxID=30085 RepID=A0A0A9VYN4_LYGHE